MKIQQRNTIRQYMEIMGLTYREAARRTGLSQQAVWLHATGRSLPGPKALRAYHRAFGISLEKLISYDN